MKIIVSALKNQKEHQFKSCYNSSLIIQLERAKTSVTRNSERSLNSPAVVEWRDGAAERRWCCFSPPHIHHMSQQPLTTWAARKPSAREHHPEWTTTAPRQQHQHTSLFIPLKEKKNNISSSCLHVYQWGKEKRVGMLRAGLVRETRALNDQYLDK